MPDGELSEKIHFEKKRFLSLRHLGRMAASGQLNVSAPFLFAMLDTRFLVYNSRYIRLADSILSSQTMLRNSIFMINSLYLMDDFACRHLISWSSTALLFFRAYIFSFIYRMLFTVDFNTCSIRKWFRIRPLSTFWWK